MVRSFDASGDPQVAFNPLPPAFRLNCFDLDKLFDVVKPAGAIAPDMVIKCRTGTDLGDIEFPCHSSILRTKAALGTGTQMVEIESDRKTLQTMLLYVYTSEKRVLWDALRGFLPDEVDEYPTTEDYAKSEAGAWWEARRRGEDRELPSAIVHDMAEYLENALRLSKCAASLNMLDTECWECIAWAWIPAAEVGRKALEAILQGVEMEEREEIMGRDDEMEG